jgi:hypothetical protein
MTDHVDVNQVHTLQDQISPYDCIRIKTQLIFQYQMENYYKAGSSIRNASTLALCKATQNGKRHRIALTINHRRENKAKTGHHTITPLSVQYTT